MKCIKNNIFKRLIIVVCICTLICELYGPAVYRSKAIVKPPPKVISIEVDNHIVKQGDVVTITAEVESSDKIHNFNVKYYNGFDQEKTIYLHEEHDNIFKGEINISEIYYNTKYSLFSYSCSTIYGNTASKVIKAGDEQYEDAGFNVISSYDDITPPHIKYISINKKKVTIGEEIVLIADLYDESGIDTFYIRYYCQRGDVIVLFEKENDKYVARYVVKEWMECGMHPVVFYCVADTCHNVDYGTECEQFSDISFEVVEDVEASPTATPTAKPSATPTAKPSEAPTAKPNATPTVSPSATPTVSPSATPTVSPSATPTVSPSVTPTAEPSAMPTASPGIPPVASHNPAITEEQKSRLKKGQTFIVNNIKYKIISISGRSGKAALVRCNKKITEVYVNKPVKYKGCSFDVKEIDNNAFAGCIKLKKAIIAGKVERIGKKAFYNTPKLSYIYIKTKELKYIGCKSFYGIYENAVIKVPRDKKKRYIKLLQGKYKA